MMPDDDDAAEAERAYDLARSWCERMRAHAQNAAAEKALDATQFASVTADAWCRQYGKP
jgi:hypothetical protein